MRNNKVYLRYLEEGDVEQLLELRSRNRDFFRSFEPIKPDSHYTFEGQLKEICLFKSDVENDKTYTYGIFLETSEQLIGRITLSGIVRGPFQNANLGYYLDKDHNGTGYTSEAVSLIIKIAFEDLNLHRIQAAVMQKNIASIRVLEKNGFRKEGLAINYLNINGSWENHLIYAITNDDNINS
ncbi:GNAT family N-acetyltransferase [Neobacillus sp. SAB-20_R2A]|uniref:GNAT family N-acetyltransferase n=1 Tax=Neobacillus sp. SAB-20_R2A TaxID=3120519 RepID=UPI003C6E8470